MGKINIGHINILETGTVTTTNEATGFPAYRLFDRIWARLFKGTSSADHTIHIDQGATGNLAINALVIPAGHNLSGATMYWEWSTDDSNWTEETHWTQADNNLIYKAAVAALTKRYWRIRMTGLSAAPEIGECYLTSLYEFVAYPQVGSKIGNKKNITREESLSGRPSFLYNGEPRKHREYQIKNISSTEKTALEAWDAGWAGIKPFFFIDPDANQFFAEKIGDLDITEEKVSRYTTDLEILEVL